MINIKQELQIVYDLLTEYLLDNTNEVFEEIPEIDNARSIVAELLENDLP